MLTLTMFIFCGCLVGYGFMYGYERGVKETEKR